MTIPHRAFLRASKINAHCWADDPLYFTVNDEKNISVMIDLFRCTEDGLQVRVTHHDPNTISPSIHLHLTTADVIAVIQFLVRRMLHLDPMPVRAFFRRMQTFLKGD